MGDAPTVAGSARFGERLLFGGLFLALAVVPATFAPQLYDDFTLAKQSALLLAAACVLVGLAFCGPPAIGNPFLKAGLGAWTVALFVSEWLAIDPRGSLLGVYQYRQGFLTQMAYLVLFLGALRLGAMPQPLTALRLLGAGLAAVTAYTAIQAVGLDPVDWWTDTSARAIGTIGNANELAAFAIVSLALCAAIPEGRGHLRTALFAAVPLAVSFVVFESESRSGVVALGLFAVLVPCAWWVARGPWRELAKPGAAALSGLLAGALLSFAAGGLAGTVSRVSSGVAQQDAGGSTRFALWRGTFEVIKAEPLHGAGPDGLALAFPVERPADLGGAFEDYDLVAQSSHNLVLDTLANYGPAGAAGLAAVVVAGAAIAVRRERGSSRKTGEPWAWAALAAYGALTLVNPISVAAQAVFFVALGLLAARTGREQPRRPARVATSAALAIPVAAGAVAIAVLLPLADLRADRGWEHYAAERFEEGAAEYEAAAALVPFERRYASDHARALLAAGVEGPRVRLLEADHAYRQFDADFGMAAGEAVGQATALIGLGAPATEVRALVARAHALNPHGVAMGAYCARLRRAAGGAAALEYSERDRWVYVQLVENAEWR